MKKKNITVQKKPAGRTRILLTAALFIVAGVFTSSTFAATDNMKVEISDMPSDFFAYRLGNAKVRMSLEISDTGVPIITLSDPALAKVSPAPILVMKSATPKPKIVSAINSRPMPTATPEVALPTLPVSVTTPPVPVVSVTDFIIRYANEYGVDANVMIGIAECESGLRPEAVNGPYAGIFQFMASTWSSNRNAMGLDPNPALRFVAEEAARTAAFKMSRDGFGAWPACSRAVLASR